MLESKNLVAKKYAVAFLNLYSDKFSIETMKKLSVLETFLKMNGYFYASLSVPGLSIKVKDLIVDRIINFFSLDLSIKNLINVLFLDGRIEILDLILRNIWDEFKKIKNIESFKISISHSVDESEKSFILNFLKTLTSKEVLAYFIVEPSLIVGLRMEGFSMIWERSIRKELLEVEKNISKKGISCE